MARGADQRGNMTGAAETELRWMRAVQQTRSKRTQTTLLDAAEGLFAEKGLDETSVTDIAARAEASVGALYHHFNNKHALYHAVIERIREEMRATNAAALCPTRWEGAGIEEILRGYLTFTILEVGPSPILRLLESPDLRRTPELMARILEVKAEFNQGLAELLLERRDEIGHPDPEVAVDFVVDLVAALSKWRPDHVIWPRRTNRMSDSDYIDHALSAAMCYLRTRDS